ncbi:phosphoenolpyruvate synthase [Patescibacteria group bacterium]|nr:phosphoenolpyruvate synthase [Patescibacteria group bacterium]
MPTGKPYVVWFKDVDQDDVSLIGEKGANLGETTQAGFPVPNGFIVTAQAYFYVLDHNQLRPKITSILKSIDVLDTVKLRAASRKVKNIIKRAEIPPELADEIIKHYRRLGKGHSESLVAIRSQATAEDLPDPSFVGRQETVFNVKGTANVIDSIRDAWASLFEPRAIFYRERKGFDHFNVGIAVPIQKMVQSQVSGVMFTVDPVTEDKSTLIIEAVWGLSEMIAQKTVTPDRYTVEKKTGKTLKKFITEQKVQHARIGGKKIRVTVPKSKQKKPKLTKKQIKEIAKLGDKIQQHYFFPQQIEWAMEKGKIHILQTRPMERKSKTQKLGRAVAKSLRTILKGDPASPGISSGKVRIIHSAREIGKIKKGDVLVTTMTTPNFVPAMRKVAAIVTDKGGQTSHAAIISRELGISCVVGTSRATKKLKTGQMITVNGKTGEIFDGTLPPTKIKTMTKTTEPQKIETTRRTATRIYVNLGEPDLAREVAARNVDGVGLLRAEFMIAQIGIHPKKMIRDGKKMRFVSKLADGLETFCRAFNPRPIIYRTTDFKTNEYRNLTGGKAYEPEEENPSIGYRGAFRYIADEAVFDLELMAIKKVRNKAGLKNLWLMIPFVRTVKELIAVKRIVASHGLTRSPSFKFWMMVEIPSNVILLEEFIDAGIDGVSVGTNDLIMLLLGVDRDNEEVAPLFDGRNPAVLWALERIIRIAHEKGVTSSVCGQAPSIYPDLTEKLVAWGITSVSVSPDMIEQTREIVYQAELHRTKETQGKTWQK